MFCRSYYKAQDELISAYEEMQLEIDDAMDNAEAVKYMMKKASFLAKITLLTNVVCIYLSIYFSKYQRLMYNYGSSVSRVTCGRSGLNSGAV